MTIRRGSTLLAVAALGVALGACSEDPSPTDPDPIDNTPPPTAPGAPTGVVAEAGHRQVTVRWDSVADAASYNIYWTTGMEQPSRTNGTRIGDVSSPYVHAPLSAGVAYYHVVTATNACGEGPESEIVGTIPVFTIPDPPSYVGATPQDSAVTVVWPNMSVAVSYDLYWTADGTDPPSGTGVCLVNVSSPFVHDELANGTPTATP